MQLTWEEYQAKDLPSNSKPVCFFITQPWCGACKKLKASFVETGDDLVSASQQYIMVSIDGDDNKNLDKKYQPDGTYVPRILLGTPSGEVKPELTAPGGNPKYNFFYTSAGQVSPRLVRVLVSQPIWCFEFLDMMQEKLERK